MSDIRATFEPGSWKDFSNEHRALREDVERSLAEYRNGKDPPPIAVWGAYGAGKTQFLFWVAERAVELGLMPIYFHLNDLLDGLPNQPSPDGLRDHARAFVKQAIDTFRASPDSESLLRVYRDKQLLRHLAAHTRHFTAEQYERPVLLLDEVEQAYKSLSDRVRADDRSPLRAWLEEESFKVCAFAVGSLYVLGRADRERLRLWSIPGVRPSYAKHLLPEIPEETVNALWWLSRGKPRHLMKAARRYVALKPHGAVEVREFVKELDSVSQAPYEADSQYAVPAVYADQLKPDELAHLLSIHPVCGQGNGKLFCLQSELETELATALREAFKMEGVAIDLVRYICMLLEAVSREDHFALSESDTTYLLRLGVDFLLEYERERLEKESVEGSAALRKLLEVHDSAERHAAEIFWKLQGRLNATENAASSLSFEALASAFPLPTTSPTLFGTRPSEVRNKYDQSRQPVFSWRNSAGNSVVLLTSVAALASYAECVEFRQRALAPHTGIVVFLPYDAGEWRSSGLLEWLVEHDRLRVLHLPLALTDFLLSLRDYAADGSDPFPIAEEAESHQNLQRQVAFYSSRLRSFLEDATCRPRAMVPSEIPKRFSETVTRVADKEILTLAARQAFESLPARVLVFLVNLRELVMNTKGLWGRSGFISLADDMLPHRSARNERPEASKIIEDMKLAFSAYLDPLHPLVAFVGSEDIEFLSDEPAGKIALRSLWQAKRGSDQAEEQLGRHVAQLSDIVLTLKGAKALEPRLIAMGIAMHLGITGILLEALQDVERVAADADALFKARGGADRKLAVALFQEFLEAFLQAAESDVAKAKAALRRLREALESIDEARARIVEAGKYESVRFAEIPGHGLELLLDTLLRAAMDDLGTLASLDDVVTMLEGVQQDYQNVEELLGRLDTAHREITGITANF